MTKVLEEAIREVLAANEYRRLVRRVLMGEVDGTPKLADESASCFSGKVRVIRMKSRQEVKSGKE